MFLSARSFVTLIIVLLAGLASFAQPPAAQDTTPALDTMHPSHRVLYFVMRRGADWLTQAQQPNGLFHQGLNVVVNQPVEPAHYLHQAEAAIAMAKVSRLTSNARYHAAAQQAMLTLLSSTKVDPQNTQLRYTVLPESSLNRLASAGLLMRLVHELPAPVEVRVKEAEGLAEFVRSQQQTDGLLQSSGAVQQVAAQADPMLRQYEGLALEGLAFSQNYANNNWKTETLQKAVRGYTQQQLPLATAPCYITSFAETYLRSKDQGCAVAVFNMADALCSAQCAPEAGRIGWAGGILLNSSKTNSMSPGAGETARAVSALCDAYRVAKLAGDATRAEKYKTCATAGVQFLTSLQFTGNSVEHFAEAYQPRVLGAFRQAPADGVIRLQDTAECVLAVSTYLSDVCGVALAPTPATPGR
jgi:hypothetical protein